jgi:ribokinase
LLTAFGDDDFGRRVQEHHRREGIDLRFARTIPETPNQVALIFVGEREAGSNLIAVAPGASGCLTPEAIDQLPDEVFASGDVLLASLEVPLETVLRGLKRAKAAGMTTILNPAPASPAVADDRPDSEAGLFGFVDVLTPNQEEAVELTGLRDGGIEAGRAAASALRRRGAREVIITLGSDGALVRTSENRDYLVPTPRVDVVDTVGAGDAFNGALAVALAEGRGLLDAVGWACVAAALSVTRPGAQGALPSRSEIDQLVRRAGNGPVSLD